MKRTFGRIVVAMAFMLSCGVFAQPIPRQSPNTDAEQTTYGTEGVRGPLAPATLILLGLGGAATGAFVYRNIKKGGEE